MWWRIIVAVWIVASIAMVLSLGSGSWIARHLNGAATEIDPRLASRAAGRAEWTGLAYGLFASLVDLAIFLPYETKTAIIVFVLAALILGPTCWFAAVMGFNNHYSENLL